MISVIQFRYGADNFSYLIQNSKSVMIIDGGAVAAILNHITSNDLMVSYITNTHLHPDHTTGNNQLIDQTNGVYISPMDLAKQKQIQLEDETVLIYSAPGHSRDSVLYKAGNFLLSGDTLFNGTIGNCFSGDFHGFFQTLTLILKMDPHTLIYSGHDYVRESLKFAKKCEPNNVAIDRFLKKYDPYHVVSTLADEKEINPYLRFNEPAIINLLESKGLPCATEYERWYSLMSLE